MKYSIIKNFTEVREQRRPIKVYESSITKKNGCIFLLILEQYEKKLVIFYPSSKRDFLNDFFIEKNGKIKLKEKFMDYIICPCNQQNASALRNIFVFTRPKGINLKPAIGTGDRIGLATPGHIRAVKDFSIFPVLAQQSTREMERALRTPQEVLDDVTWAVFQEGYRKGFVADADHLKREGDIDATIKAGYTMYTIDPSDYVDNEADTYDLKTLRDRFNGLALNVQKFWKEDLFKLYLGKKFILSIPKEGKIIELEFSEETLLRAAVKYSTAISYTTKMYQYIKKHLGRKKFDFEMSVDETKFPTTPLEHFFIISELKRFHVQFQGLALKFVGKFEKAIDYINDLKEFEKSFREHVFIARACGQYKLSIHSGSDKFSIYPIVGGLAADIIHLKTAGTSYLEALRVIARHNPALFREIIKYSLKCFEKDRKSYLVSTNLSLISDPEKIQDKDLEKVFLSENNGRQLLHITYGSILTAKTSNGEWLFRDRLRRILFENDDEHYETVKKHIKRHIESLWIEGWDRDKKRIINNKFHY